jgi:hypothetical protein
MGGGSTHSTRGTWASQPLPIVRYSRRYLNLPHQLHGPKHLDDDLLPEGNWAAELGSRETRLTG